MSDSLRDQLLKAGFAPKPQPEPRAKPPRHARAGKPGTPAAPSRPRPPRPPRHDQSDIDLGKAYALRDKHERETREREQREAERRAREKKERRQKLGALLEGKALNAKDAEIPRHFPHTNKIRRIYVTDEQLEHLNRGRLGVVQMRGRYLLVERALADEVQAIDGNAIALIVDPE